VAKEVAKEIRGKPVRFEALPPEVFQGRLSEKERSIRSLRRVLTSLKRVRERNIMPRDTVEERYLSFGSQSALMKLKEAVLKAQTSVKCLVDSWGFHLIQECSDELETVCGQDVEVRVVASFPTSPPSLPFSSSRMKIRYGRHMAGRSAFIIDNSELIMVNSQTGRGFAFTMGDVRAAIGEDLFTQFWDSSTTGKVINAATSTDDLAYLVDHRKVSKLFVEAVTRALKEDETVEAIGEEFLALVEERASPRLRQESFDGAVKLILALMEEELGEEAMAEYDPLTRIFRMELPSSRIENGAAPSSVWYFALSGLLKATGTKSELLHDALFPEARNRIIQRKFAGADRNRP
jgi:sugar-specific transcriptional regulator TrmB